MPETPTEYRYYPALSDIMKTDDLPDFLSFIKDGLQAIFDKIYYKDYQVSKSISGSSAFYSLDLVSRTKIALELPGTNIYFVLNPDYEDSNISSFPVTVFWQWEVMRYIRYFDVNGFSFSPEDFYNLALEILNVSEEQVFQLAINTFVTSSNPSISKLDQLIEDINNLHGSTISIDTSASNQLQELIIQIELINKKVFPTVFALYVLANDIETTKQKINTFFSSFIPNDIDEYIKNIITPKARVTLKLSAAIEFPRTILVPWKDNGSGTLIRDEDETQIARFQFAEALLYADTQAGIGYNLELAGTLNPTYCEIGKTGMLLQIESLKLDLSKKTNIPEADADGRPNDFTGVYARAISVTLPAKWFNDETPPGGTLTTLRIGGYELLVGTGGISGTIALESISLITPGQTPYYYEDKFNLNYPIILFQKNVSTQEIDEVSVEDITELKSLLFPPSATEMPTYSFKFPLTLVELPGVGGQTRTFTTLSEYQLYLTSLSDGILWKKLGGADGFRVGFQKFDITFKQNKVVSSNIKGALEIKKFVYPEGAKDANGNTIPYPTIVNIGIEGHLSDNGDFNLTASASPPFPIELKDVFTYHLKSVELGKEEEKFYIGTAGTLQFEGFLKDTMGLGPIEIERLRIYSDGTIELKGGSVQLVKPIVLKLGPVEITVSAIHYGSHQKEVDGVMRKFNYFGFDGGISVDPLGVEIRGDGVKFYYCVDELPDKPNPYLHIQTLYLDLTIPAKSPVAIINGWLSIPEPGISKEYAGGIKIQIPKAKISGSADMKLMPKYPAFIIDAEIDLPAPIPLGTFAIYGFRGLLGYRYVAEKEAIGLVSGVNTWYEYYKAPQRGINVRKFNGPDKTKLAGMPFSIGAGASLGTSADNGTILNIKAMVLLSIPSLFMIDGRASVLSARLGLEDTKDPPFFAFVALGDDSIEFGFGADFKMPTKTGKILTVYADIGAGFFFKNQHPWYVNIGTKTNPVTARILTLLTIKSYVMLSAKGIEAGARGEFNFDRNYGVIRVKAHAFIEVGGRISFERPQLGAYLEAGVSASIKVLFVHLSLDVGILFGVEVPKPFLLYGKFYFRIRIKVWRITLFKFSGNLEVVWNFNKNVDRSPINPLINEDNFGAIPYLVKGVNMLSNELFNLAPLSGVPGLNESPLSASSGAIMDYVIPLDTYIDIKTEKGLLPGNLQNPQNSVNRLIGGINNPPKNYIDLVPPVSSIRGRNIRQVAHTYAIDEIAIKFWDGTTWQNYHPYEAMYPTTFPTDPTLQNLKIGQFQKTDGQYNTVRILATTPLSYTEQGEPGWYIPEQYGINATTLFCEGEAIGPKCAGFLQKPLHAHYQCWNPNTPVISNEVAFLLLTSNQQDDAYITNESNVFNITKSLAFDNWNSMQIVLPDPSVQIGLKLSNFSNGVKIKYYSIIISDENDELFNVVYGNPNPNAINANQPYEIVVSGSDLNQQISYNHPEWNAVSKIEVEPIFDSFTSQQIATLSEQIAVIENDNMLIGLGVLEGEIISTVGLEEELQQLICGASSTGINVTSFVNRYSKPDKLNYYYSKEFYENESNFIYSIGTTEKNGLISKINSNGSLVWERSYHISSDRNPLVFKRIIQLKVNENNEFKYIVYATTGNSQYILSFNPSDGEIAWMKKIMWRDEDVFVHLAPSKTDFTFYLVISDRNQLDNNRYPYVAKFDSLGDLITGKLLVLREEEFIVNSICEDEDGFVAAGRFIEGDYKDSVSIIVKLDRNLKIINSLKITDSYTTIHDIKVINENRYLVSGYDNKRDGIFVSLIGGEGTFASYYLPNTINHRSSLQLDAGNERFYLLLNDDYNGILNQLDFNFNLIWSKDIYFSSSTNGIRNFTFNTQSRKITLNCFNQSEGSLVTHTKDDFESCLTRTLDSAISRFDIRTKKIGVEEEKFDTDTVEINSQLTPLNSVIRQYCQSSGCEDEDPVLCELYSTILGINENCLVDPTINGDINFEAVLVCLNQIVNLIKDFDVQYNLNENLNNEINLVYVFSSNFTIDSYTNAWNGVQSILNYLNEIGNCVCDCAPKNFTMIHQVCWMSLQDHQYNINIPSQATIEADAQATIDGLTNFIQPIWRPDTQYYIHFVLKDIVDNGANVGTYPFTYGFSTAGPVGFFHTNDKSTYGDLVLKSGDRLLKQDDEFYIVSDDGLRKQDNSLYIANSNGFILEDTTGILKDKDTKVIIIDPSTQKPLRVASHADKYALTSLRQYIDYSRSYPNADGNLLSAKPLFYDDTEAQTTQISIYYNKAYATNFFRTWEEYHGKEAVIGRLKIVIKDPVEDISIVNPPYLDYDPADTIHTSIPQTELTWQADENPQIPFAISQYLNMYNADNCIGQFTIIKPASEYVTIFPKHLKPNKLYTALVNNMFDLNGDGELVNIDEQNNTIYESVEVHKFVFKTSIYKDFSEQINSFYRQQDIEGTLAQRNAIITFKKAFSVDEINATFITILNANNDATNQLPVTGFTPEILATLNNDYQHPYDRIFEGILGIKPWDEPVSTEINIIKDETTNVIIALIVRNPEPFNNPKFPIEVVKDTLEVLNATASNPYYVLFSKDNSQAILMNQNHVINENLDLKFKYKVYKDILPPVNLGANYNSYPNYPVVSEVVLNVDLLNN